MKRTVSIFYRGQKVLTGQVEGVNEGQTEDRAFAYADSFLGLIDEADRAEVELCFHDNRRALILFGLDGQYIERVG